MNTDLRHTFLSRPRYNRYLIATENDNKRAKKLYNANIRLAHAFHPLLTQFEVVLRNSLNVKLTSHFGDIDWIINQKTGFMKHNSLKNSHFFMKTCIHKTENKLSRRHIKITSGKIISDQTFGFWISFFLSHHYALAGGQPIHIFKFKPVKEDRASLYFKLNEIRSFRNRVNHCEPICFSGHTIDCTKALEIRAKLYSLIEWINPKLIPFFENLVNIQSKVSNIMSLK